MPVTDYMTKPGFNKYGMKKVQERSHKSRLFADKQGFVDLLQCGTYKDVNKLRVWGVIGAHGNCEISTPESINDSYFFVGEDEPQKVELILEPPVMVMTYGLLSPDWLLVGEVIE